MAEATVRWILSPDLRDIHDRLEVRHKGGKIDLPFPLPAVLLQSLVEMLGPLRWVEAETIERNPKDDPANLGCRE